MKQVYTTRWYTVKKKLRLKRLPSALGRIKMRRHLYISVPISLSHAVLRHRPVGVMQVTCVWSVLCTSRCARRERILSVGDVQRHVLLPERSRHGYVRPLRPDACRSVSSGRLLRRLLRRRSWIRRTTVFRKDRMCHIGSRCRAVPGSTVPQRPGRILWGCVSMCHRWDGLPASTCLSRDRSKRRFRPTSSMPCKWLFCAVFVRRTLSMGKKCHDIQPRTSVFSIFSEMFLMRALRMVPGEFRPIPGAHAVFNDFPKPV